MHPRFKEAISEADALLREPIAPWSDEAYLEFSRSGDRSRGEAMLRARNAPLTTLVLAECTEGQGRFLSRISDQLDAITSERSWTLPAHDKSLENFRGTHPSIDLNAATLGHQVAETLYLLGKELPKPTYDRAMAALERHVFRPFEQTLAGKDHQWWLDATNNWNAVCLDGVTGAAMASIPDRNRRAVIAAAADNYQHYYLRSFRESGYADEGIGYWSYGFSHYTDLREVLWIATSGHLDLFDDAQAVRAARFAFDFAMLPGVYADFGDAHFMARPDAKLMAQLGQAFGWTVPPGITEGRDASPGDLVTAVRDAMPLHSQKPPRTAEQDSFDSLRTYFSDVGVLVDRPARSTASLAITIKGGGNSNHSHNDIGSYSIGMGSTQVVGDPGGPLFYTADVFNSKRYESALLNSLGHPVPVINGAQQLEATKVTPRVLKTEFTPERDSIAIDMTPAYRAPGLRRLVRTMRYVRQGQGWIEIEDRFDLDGEAEIVESLPTHGTWRELAANELGIDFEDAHLTVQFEAPRPFTYAESMITDYGEHVRRVGAQVHLNHSGTITMRFRPNLAEGQ